MLFSGTSNVSFCKDILKLSKPSTFHNLKSRKTKIDSRHTDTDRHVGRQKVVLLSSSVVTTMHVAYPSCVDLSVDSLTGIWSYGLVSNLICK